MRCFYSLLACAALNGVVLIAGSVRADAGQRTACEVLPVATVSAALGAQLETHEVRTPSPNGGISYTCAYLGPQKQATVMVAYDTTPAMAAADRDGWNRVRGAGGGSDSGIAGTKGSVAVMIDVHQHTSEATLKRLLAAALSNL